MTMAQRKKTKKIVLTIVMLILALIYIYPVFLMVINSVKPFGEVIMDVIALPSKIEWSNYTYVMDKMQYGKLFLNNVIITVIGIVGIIIFSSMSAYIISRKKNKYDYNTYADPVSDHYDHTSESYERSKSFRKQGRTWNTVLGIRYSHGCIYLWEFHVNNSQGAG